MRTYPFYERRGERERRSVKIKLTILTALVTILGSAWAYDYALEFWPKWTHRPTGATAMALLFAWGIYGYKCFMDSETTNRRK